MSGTVGRLSRKGLTRLIREDIRWLMKQPESLEREHIVDVLKASITYEHDVLPALRNAEAHLRDDPGGEFINERATTKGIARRAIKKVGSQPLS